jgi:UDP-N-acetylglucosamine transferase subunit ALG13
MILVTVGASDYPFDRLLEAFDDLAQDEEVLVQHGASFRCPRNAKCVDFISFEELIEHIRAARVVVTHGGTGSILVALANGKRPIVVPRRRDFGEAIDDHQIDLARALAPSGLIKLVEDPCELPGVVAREEAGNGSAPNIELDGPLARDLGGYLRTLTAPGATA